jgi:uncharacterized delta-60 repeat protein
MTKKLFILVILVLAAVPAFAGMAADTAWVRVYNGPGNSDDEARALAMDGSGNVFVTGWSTDSSGYYPDYATLKYDPAGNQLWVYRYNGPGNSSDIASAIVADDSGNVYVTGYSMGNGTYYDYATIKYCPNGDTAWVRRYNGSTYSVDEAVAMALDDSGNIYVTGSSDAGWPSYADIATIKYYSNGDTAWVRRYNGPASSTDAAAAIAVDSSGNVYVTGYSQGGGTFEDFVTIKYRPSGDTAWVRRYEGPYTDKATAITVDGSGNVYVTGGYGGDYATIKYDSSGDTVWVRSYSSDEGARAIALDESGDIYVTGGSWGEYATVKYSPDGDTAWARTYKGTGSQEDIADAIAIDSSGNAYLTGYSFNSDTYYDFATIKYYPNGDTAWVKGYEGPGTTYDQAYAIAVDGSGNIYVTGGSGGDYLTIKYAQFLCGDCNQDGVVDVGDVVYLINYLFRSGPLPVPILHAGDANCDQVVDVGDVIFLINYLFKSEPAPSC